MSIIVVIKPEQDRADWIEAMRGAGLAFAEFEALPLFFQVDGVSIVTFPLVNHPGYDVIEPADLPIRPAAQQDFVLDEYLQTARWHLARIVRRRAPWPTVNAKFPQNAYFRCVRDGAGVDIYIVDSGVRTTHADFGGRATNVYDATGAGPGYFHGTFCAAMAAGATSGTARAASIFSFQYVDANGFGDLSFAVSAINQALTHYNGRAATNRPAVCNMSFESTGSASLTSAVSSLINAGMVVVAAAGNSSVDLAAVDVMPAESDADVIVAGASAACDIPYYVTINGSNYGTRVDISAPGHSVYSAMNTGDADYLVRSGGTSFATACVTGAIACMLQGYPRLTSRAQVQAVRNHVRNTATAGKLRSTPQQVLPDRLLYLNPDLATEAIPGL